MPYPNEHAARLRDPERYEKFRRENDRFGDGIHAIFGILKSGKVELQAIRFDAGKYTAEEARRWLAKHGYRPIMFEPAAEKGETKSMDASMVPQDILLCEAEIKIEAAAEGEKKLRRFQMTAYTGGEMNLAGWPYPVVVDLAGLVLGRKSRPILLNHDMEKIVGHSQAVVMEGGVLTVSGVISGTGAAAAEVVGAADNGFPWQASIGAAVKKVVFIPEGKTASANGREFSGPVYIVRSSRLCEVSFVALGADDATAARVVAGKISVENEGERQMENKEITAAEERQTQTQADDAVAEAVRAERERVAAISEICQGEFRDIEAEAIKAGWSVEETSRRVLKAMRDRRPAADVHIAVKADRTPEQDVRVMEAALSLRAGISEDALLKSYGEQVMDAAYRARNISLAELCAKCARLEGKDVPASFGNDMIRAGFSTVSLPGILGNVANKRLLKAFYAQEVAALRLCSEGEISDFKESERYRLTDVGDLQQVAPDGELKHGSLSEDKATNQLATYGKIFTLTRQMMYNDDLGAFLKIPEAMGARAARKIDQLFFTRLLANPTQSDGYPLFDATHHKNYKAGSDTTLNGAHLGDAIQMFLSQTDSDGQPINVQPKFLLVPPALYLTAKELLNSTYLLTVGGTSSTTRTPTFNPFADSNMEVVCSPYLSNSAYSGHSALAWYLFADPAVVDTFEIGYLRGQKTPIIEKGETDFNTLGIQYRVIFDIGVREQDFRGMVKFKGEA